MILPDLRTHAETDQPKEPFPFDAWVEDLAQPLDFLELPRAVLVGNSLSGGIVQAFAFAYFERVRAMGLIATRPERYPG